MRLNPQNSETRDRNYN